MDEKPIPAREAIPWIMLGSTVGAGLSLAICCLLGLFGNVVATSSFSGFGGASGAVIGLKIAAVRRRNRP
jgi:ABC-type Fe3+-siderophore transport system permease subunit